MKLNEQVAKNIHTEIYKAGRNNSALALKLGLSRQAISQKMRGEVAFSLNEVGAIAKWLNIPIATLFNSNNEDHSANAA